MNIRGEDSYALVCTSAGEIQIQHSPISAGAGEILVEVIVCDISPLDRQVAEGRFPPGPPFPVIPGTTAVVRDSEGKLFFAFVEMQGGGLFTPGIHRTIASVKREFLIPIPRGVDPLDVAAGMTGLVTALAIINHTIKLKPGKSILIMGANRGVGAAAVEVALNCGAIVFAAARSQLNIPGVNCLTYDQLPAKLLELNGGKGVDAIIDSVGGDLTNKALMSGGMDCMHVLLGFSAGVQLSLRAPRFLGTEHQLIGFNLGRRPWKLIEQLMFESLDYFSRGKGLPNIAQRVPFAEAAKAYKNAASQNGRTLLMVEGYSHG